MKNLKKILVLALALAMVFSFAACGDNEEPASTPRPTPSVPIVDVPAEQLNNYFIQYDVTKSATEQDATGNYVTAEKTTSFVEVGFSSVVLKSEDGGTSFKLDSSGVQCFSIYNTSDDRSFLSAHLRYEKDELENQGTETVAGKECTHYFYKNGLMKIHMYVDESFSTTGVCLKYVDEGFELKTVEVKELSFGVINTEGYMFADYQSKIATPAPAEDAEAAAQ